MDVVSFLEHFEVWHRGPFGEAVCGLYETRPDSWDVLDPTDILVDHSLTEAEAIHLISVGWVVK